MEINFQLSKQWKLNFNTFVNRYEKKLTVVKKLKY